MKTPILATETAPDSHVPASPEPRRKRKQTNKAARVPAAPARKGTKGARIVALLKKPSGVSLKSLMQATGWQAHSVRAFLSAYVGKRLGLPVKSVAKDGQRIYAIQK